MQRHEIFSDLALGLLIVGIPMRSILDHFPIRDLDAAQNGASRFEAGETVEAWTSGHAEALASMLRLLAERDLSAALAIAEDSATHEGSILADAIESERDARDLAESDAPYGDDEDDLDDLARYETDDSLSFRDDASDWDDSEPIEAWDDEVAF